jgi:hypothetical protein
MSRAVLELNDHQLGLYNHNGLMFSSPGYVLVSGKHVQFGQQAAEQSRLNPLGTNNEFWHRLGMTPLTRPVAHFRHYADVAHGHLLHLAQESGFEGEIVIAVPASFSREQLAVLTGVLRHSPFKPVAMMDAALVSASHQLAAGSELLYVDVQLHQLSLTRLHTDGSAVRRDAVSVVPGAGWTGISNILVQAATEAFVAQSRFNPQHSAAWEQQLYNQIPLWLQHFYDGDQELIGRVQTDKNTIQARISLSDVLDALEPVFQKVAQHATRIITDVSKPVLLSGRAALVPGLQQCLSAINHQVSPEQLADLCLRAAANAGNESAGHSGTVPFLNVLSLETLRHSHLKSPLSANLASVSQTPAVSTRSVTHVLSEGVAWPLPVEVCLQQDSGVVIRTLRPADNSRSAGTQLLVIGRQDNAAHLLPHSEGISVSEGITVNGEAVTTARSLLPGDRIRVGAISADMQCIYVHDGGADHG